MNIHGLDGVAMLYRYVLQTFSTNTHIFSQLNIFFLTFAHHCKLGGLFIVVLLLLLFVAKKKKNKKSKERKCCACAAF